MKYSQIICYAGGSIECSGHDTKQEALSAVVGIAISEGLKPPNFWQLWKYPWTKAQAEEYKRQVEDSP